MSLDRSLTDGPTLPPLTPWQRFSVRHPYAAAAVVLVAAMGVAILAAYFVGPLLVHLIGIRATRVLSLLFFVAVQVHYRRRTLHRWILDALVPTAALTDWHQ